MEDKVIKAQKEDYDELLKFENHVFRVPFRVIMPKLYKDKELCVSQTRVIKEDEKIIAAYSLCKNEFVTSSGSLNVSGVASVGVAKKHRNKGLMSKMLRDADKDAKENSTDIGFLGGLRHRYERFGYIPCGEKYVFEITAHYASHHKAQKNFTFAPLSKKRELVKNVCGLFEKQNTHFLRDESNFEIITDTWRDRCFVILYNNEFIGYLVADNFRNEIREINLTESVYLTDVLLNYLKEFSKKKATLWLFPWQRELISQAHIFGESFHIKTSASLKIFNFRRTIEVMMNSKLKDKTLSEGTLKIMLGEENLKVTVKGGICEVINSDEEPEISLSYYDAMLTLTTHHGCDSHPLLRDWSPMCEIAVPSSDKV